ncbi:Sushi, von Willebrand factor type A, EGF and pentraxin domain-containing protein 1, partial [Ophiophagus hannah]
MASMATMDLTQVVQGPTLDLVFISGQWRDGFSEDVEPPQINCPNDIETSTLENQNSANISWQIPDAADNSRDEVLVQVTPAFIPPYLFPIGEVDITYTATDRAGNEASCSFKIKVIDIEPPVIDECRSPLPIQTTEKEHRVTWDEPQFSDNSGSPCEIPFTPLNGDFKCTENESGVNCTLFCMEGYDFTTGSNENYYCAYADGIWNPPYSHQWPDCSLNRLANHGFKSFEMLYKATRCDDNNLLKNFVEVFQSALGKMVPSFCNDVDDIDCRFEDLPQKHCLEYNYDYENGFAIGPGGWGAINRLDYSYDDFVEVDSEEQQPKLPSDSMDMANSRVKRHKKMNMPMSDHKIKLIFNITATIPLPDKRNDSLEAENQQRLLKTLERITNRLKRTLNKHPMYSFQLSSELLIADINSLEAEKAFLFCKPGSVLRGRMCGRHSMNVSSNHAITVEPVNRLEVVTFAYAHQDMQVRLKCEKEIDECKSSPCLNKGICKDGTAAFICQCQPGYSGTHCETEVNECLSNPCFNKATCEDQVAGFHCKCLPGFIGALCEKNINECLSRPCKNGAACKDGINGYRCHCVTGYTGPQCEVNINECESNPCENQGTCMDALNSYVCKCPPGFTGSRWVLYVNGKESITDCPSVNDGNWHHITVTWASGDGAWGVYIDGKLSDGGNGLSVGTEIPGGGALVLGQEQDQRGEGFNPAESFVGSISQLNIWGYALPPEQVKSLATSCPEDLQKGNVLAWPDFLPGVVGRVKIDPRSIFCADVDECAVGSDCDSHASCLNTNGSYICTCIHPYTGDGKKCAAISCGIPPHPKNGAIDGSRFTFGSKVMFSLQGPSVLVCEALGNWSSSSPDCEIISCGLPPVIKDAIVTGNNFTFGNTITYTCKEGYTLLGPDTVSCLADGKWNLSQQQCVAVSCDEPPPVEHASPESGHRLFGDIAIYYCSDGYSLAGNSQLLCNAQGKWIPPSDQDIPKCIADFCERPESVSYSILESSNKARFSAGSVVSFKCTEGFVLNTSAKIECVRGGQWNPSPLAIQCIPVRCGEPASIANGYSIGTNYSFGAIVAYSCIRGYYIKGEKKRTCEATGTWSGTMPTCHPVSCGEPLKLANGMIKNMTGRSFGSEVTYQCNEGYQLIGSSRLFCQSNRQWYSEAQPSCVILNCGEPPTFQHGFSKGKKFEVGATVSFFCVEGYELIGDVSWTCQKSGMWNKMQSPQCIPTKCPEPPLTENQLVLKEMADQVGIVQLSCREGLILYGASILRCLSSQQWNDSFPVCKMVLCRRPPYIPFGDPVVSSLQFGSTVNYTCMDGFLLKGTSTIICQADGTWSSPLPECIPVECPQPGEIQNGIVDVQGLTYLSTALYSCKPGFELMGNTTILCGEDGGWLGGEPSCKPIECSKPREIKNGRYSYVDLHYTHTVTYSCDRGFRLEGQRILTCLETREWDTKAPSCRAINCNPPQPIENGFVEGADYSYGAMVIYSCIPGFQLSGLAMQICEETGWSSVSPVCLPTDCGLPPHIDFGGYVTISSEEKHFGQEDVFEESFLKASQSHLSLKETKHSSKAINSLPLSSYLYGTTVLYSCYSGYELLGNSVLACQEDGMWNGSAPACISIQCELPLFPENGFVHFTENTVGSTVKYTCNPGYKLIGSDTRHCMSGRQWSDSAPTCKIISCAMPSRPMNGIVKGQSYTYGSVVQYDCDHGFQLNGLARRTCQSDQTWDGNEPLCIPISCGQVPYLENGEVSGEEYTFQNYIEYSCKEGFLLKGDRKRVCLADGYWSGNTPVCRPVQCSEPVKLVHGQIIGSEFGVGKTITVFCDEGYILRGTLSRTCQANGTWDKEPPFCEPVNCGPPEDISHGFLNGSVFSFGEYIEYVCFPGYELQGNPVRQCQSNGLWSGRPSSCLLCECPIPTIQNGIVIGNHFSCGKKIEFQCLEGFKLLGPSEITCEAIGRWSSGFPHCGLISCGPPPVIPYAFINGGSLVDQNTIIYNCEMGYVMQGSSELTCTERGVWSRPYPNCTLLTCGPPPTVPHAVAFGESQDYGSKVQYRKCPMPPNITNVIISGTEFSVNKSITLSCPEGYLLMGTSTSTCQHNGTWAPLFSNEICTPVSCGKPEAPEYGVVIGNQYNYKDTVLYKCNVGYELEGNAERICHGDKLWSGVTPVCKKISCGSPEPVDNGPVVGKGFLLGDEVLYSCNQGYELQGPTRRICHVNKKWAALALTCVSIRCEAPPTVANAFSIATENMYKSNTYFVCNFGYHLCGPENITCLANGSWSQPLPTCEGDHGVLFGACGSSRFVVAGIYSEPIG